jgi:exopolysaccharide production protein ExoZ
MYNWLKGKLEISHGAHNSLRAMEGLRGVAVFLVFWVHYSSQVEPWISAYTKNISHFIHSFGNLGVDLFFVLSGYLIYGSIINKKEFSIAGYSRRRIQRIYPTFLVVFFIYIALSFIFPSESKLPHGIIESLIYVSKNILLLPGLFDVEPIITVAWSLSYELFYYLTIPIVIFSLKLKSWKVEARIKLWIFISIIGLIAYLVLGGPIRLLMFICGIILFEVHSKKMFSIYKGGTRFLFVALAIFGLRSIFGFSYSLSIISIYVLFLLLCLCAFNPRSNSYKWLTLLPLRWLGNMSYSYYLMHGLGLIIPAGYNSSSLYYWLWIPVFLFTLVTSFVLFWLIERPLSLEVRRVGEVSKGTLDKSPKPEIVEPSSPV